MKRSILTLSSAIAVVVLAGLIPALSQDASEERKKPANPNQPGAEHAWLAEDAGEWTIRAKMFQPGTNQTFVVVGKSKMEMLWGRYLKEEFSIGEGDFVMRGIGLLAFDVQTGEFMSVYCLNTGTSMSLSTGALKDDVLTLSNEQAGPDKVKIVSRSVVTRKSRDERIVKYFVKRGDNPEEQKFEMTYTRVGKSE